MKVYLSDMLKLFHLAQLVVLLKLGTCRCCLKLFFGSSVGARHKSLSMIRAADNRGNVALSDLILGRW